MTVFFEALKCRSIGEIIRGVILIYEVLTPEDVLGKVEYL